MASGDAALDPSSSKCQSLPDLGPQIKIQPAKAHNQHPQIHKETKCLQKQTIHANPSGLQISDLGDAKCK